MAFSIPASQTAETPKLDQLLALTDIALPLAICSLVFAVLLAFWADPLMEAVFQQYRGGYLVFDVVSFAIALQLIPFARRNTFSQQQLIEILVLVAFTAISGFGAWRFNVRLEQIALEKAKVTVIAHSYFVFVFACLFSRFVFIYMASMVDRINTGAARPRQPDEQ